MFKEQNLSLKRLLLLLLVGVVLDWVLRTYVVEVVYASSASMEPTLDVKQFVLVIKCWYDFSVPQRLDVVLLDHEGQGLLKRVIGLPGEQVEVRLKDVYINGAKLSEPYAVHRDAQTDEHRDNWEPQRLPAGSYFVMGDNRDLSKDSRIFGPIYLDHIQGKVIVFF